MEDLILKYSSKEITFEPFDKDGELPVTVYDGDVDIYFYFNPSQTRELIAHLTKCLKEVEGEN